jgi:hypothetical protein
MCVRLSQPRQEQRLSHHSAGAHISISKTRFAEEQRMRAAHEPVFIPRRLD